MDSKKKQMVLLGVLGALALGAGGYYVFLRDSGPARQFGSGGGVSEKKERKVDAGGSKSTKKESTARKSEDPPKATEKRVREETQEARSDKRSRETKDRKIEKKKKMEPAA